MESLFLVPILIGIAHYLWPKYLACYHCGAQIPERNLAVHLRYLHPRLKSSKPKNLDKNNDLFNYFGAILCIFLAVYFISIQF